MKNASLSWRLPAALLLLTLCLTSPAAAQTAQFTGLTVAYDPAANANSSTGADASTTDAAGNTFLWFTYQGPFTLGGVAHPTPDLLIHQALAKLNPAGRLVWLRETNTGVGHFDCHNLATDAAGNVYAMGRACCDSAAEIIDGMPIASIRAYGGMWLAKWNALGSIQYARQAGYPVDGDVFPRRMTISPNGDLLVTGTFIFDMVIGADTLQQIRRPRSNNFLSFNGFLARFTNTGAAVWARAFQDADSSSTTFPVDIGGDQAGNTYCLGIYGGMWGSAAGHTGIGGVAFPVGSGQFWVKLNPAGQVLNTRTENSRSGGAMSFVVAPDGSSYAAYSLSQPLTIRPGVTLRPGGAEATFVFKYAPDGAPQWIRQFSGHDTTDYVHTSQCNLALGTAGEVLVGGDLRGVLDGGAFRIGQPAATRQSISHTWVAAMGAATGEPLWGQATTSSRTGSIRTLNALPGGGAYVTAVTRADTVRAGGLLVAPGNANYKLVAVRLAPQYNTLSGAAYLDANANGVQNAAETGFPGGLVVEVNPGAVPCAAPESTGHYDAYLDLGVNFTATLPAPPPHYTVVGQGGAPATFSTYGGVAAGRSFALQPIAGQQDVQVLLTLISPARPGALVTYQVQYRNTGTVALPAGSVALAADARLLYQTASQAPATSGAAGLTWAYANLLPGQTRRFTVTFRLPAATPLGGRVISTATVAPLAGDLLPDDNTSTASRIVTSSFDPNDIEVNHTLLSTNQVAAGEWLEYTVRFQNHGSDTAFTVALHDSLPAHLLRLGTLQLLAASHNCNWSISPAGRLLVRFDGIGLPSQTTNPIASDGFVRFRVRPVGTLVPGDQIPNRAAIFFDYNLPMATNTALTTIQTTLGLADENSAAEALRIWPNPASGLLHVEAARAETSPLTLTLTDALGRTVRTTALTANRTTLDISGLPAGLYVLRGVGAGAPFSQRLVVR